VYFENWSVSLTGCLANANFLIPIKSDMPLQMDGTKLSVKFLIQKLTTKIKEN
jgi:hypothetical protein